VAKKLLVKTVEAEIAKGSGESGDRKVFDTTPPGFALRLRGKAATYVYTYRYHGRQQVVKIGDARAQSLEAAREIATDFYNVVRGGGDPAAERRADRARRLTVNEMVDAYLADLKERVERGANKGRQSSLAEFTKLAARSIRPQLGRLEAQAVTSAQVKAWQATFAGTPAAGNRAASLAAAAYSYALRRDATGELPPRNPFVIALPDRFKENPKRPRYTLPEIEKIGAALRDCIADGSVSERDALGLRLYLYTGMRKNEIFGHAKKSRRSEGDGLRWSDVDLGDGVIRLRQAKAGARLVVLPSVLRDALRAARPAEVADADVVVPGRSRTAPLGSLEYQLREVFRRAKVAFRGVHAFRRTFATVAGELGIGEFIVAGLLGHGSSSMTSRYVIPGTDPLRLAADRVAGEIAGALDGTLAPVLDFTKHRAGA
jgi:integrase